MSRVVHFEIHALDPARAARFYETLFGWKFTRWEGEGEYYLIRTGEASEPGIDGGLLRRRGDAPADGAAVNAFVCTVDVHSVDASLAALPSLGGSVALPKMPVPGIGWLAYGKDPEGNIFGMLEANPTVG